MVDSVCEGKKTSDSVWGMMTGTIKETAPDSMWEIALDFQERLSD